MKATDTSKSALQAKSRTTFFGKEGGRSTSMPGTEGQFFGRTSVHKPQKKESIQKKEGDEDDGAKTHPGGVTSVHTKEFDLIEDNEYMFWNYRVGNAELREEHKQQLENEIIPRWQKTLRDKPELMVNIVGSASKSGGDSLGTALASGRSEKLKSFLVSRGIAKGRILNSGVGSTQPLADDTTPENMARNRRTEMFLFVQTHKVDSLGPDVQPIVSSFSSTFDNGFRDQNIDRSKNLYSIRSLGIRSSAKVKLSGAVNANIGFIQFLTADSRVGNYGSSGNSPFLLDYGNCVHPFLPCRDVKEAMNQFSFEGPSRVANPNGQETDIQFDDTPGVVLPLTEGSGNLETLLWNMEFVLVLGVRQDANFLPLKFQQWFLEFDIRNIQTGQPEVAHKSGMSNEGNGAPGNLDIDKAMRGRTCRFVMRRIENPNSTEGGCRPLKN